MALVIKDRVQETTTTTGTGTVTLGGAVLGYQTFASIGNGNTTYYAIFDKTAGDWEVGIGTYTSSGTTLSRDTVLSSSNAGSLVPFASGTKNVICTYPSERAVYLDQPGSYPVQNTFNSLTAATATLTAGTIANAPTSGTDIVNKDYADSIASGLNYHQPVNYASTTALPAYTYSNGTLGVGATITANANGALSFGGGSPTTTQRLLVKDEAGANQPYNGIYTVTQTGSSTTPFILTRASDYDTSGSGTNEIDAGDYVLVISGTNASTAWVQQTPLPIVVGTTALVFLQFNAPITYSAGTGLNLSPATTFNISNTGVAATTYGSASQVPVFAVNAQGQLTSVTDTAIAIAAGAVSGLAASATTDTTNASNISSGTLGTSRLSGSYTGITGVGTLTAGTWNASTIGPTYGGTGFTSYAVGDILYANTTTSLAKLADVATGNALISGGVGSAPSWGKIGLATHVSGTLPIANGGTGSTSTQFVDLTTNVTGILPAANGGTGNGFTKFSGATTAEKTYTLPDASTTILTTNAAVTVAQGGTGATTLTLNNVLLGNGTSAPQFVAPGTTGNVLTSNGTTWTSAAAGGGFDAGTALLFYQAAAPTGWTKSTTNNDKVLRVVSGATGGSAGGTTAFSSVFTNQTPTITTSGLSAGATTLNTTQIPSHSHTIQIYTGGSGLANPGKGNPPGPIGGANTDGTGGGGSHTHPVSGSATSSAITLNVQYIDVIVCTKN